MLNTYLLFRSTQKSIIASSEPDPESLWINEKADEQQQLFNTNDQFDSKNNWSLDLNSWSSNNLEPWAYQVNSDDGSYSLTIDL